MRGSVFAIAVVSFFLVGQFFSIPCCYGQMAQKGTLSTVAPVKQAATGEPFNPAHKETIREIVKEETSSWKALVGAVIAALIAIFGIAVWPLVRGLKKKAESRVQEIEELLNQAQMIVKDIKAIRDEAEKQAKRNSDEMKAKGRQILADLGDTFTPRPRYVFIQGESIESPSWQFDFVIFGTIGNALKGLLRTSGGAAFRELTEEEKEEHEWHESSLILHENRSITLERPLPGKLSGHTQSFHGKRDAATMTINAKTARVWEGHWSGYGAEGASGAFVVYLD
jgi:hypothetical protein